jgi:hypothetical protein
MEVMFVCQSRYGGYPDGDPYIVTLESEADIQTYRSGWSENGSGEPVALPFWAVEVPQDNQHRPMDWYASRDA